MTMYGPIPLGYLISTLLYPLNISAIKIQVDMFSNYIQPFLHISELPPNSSARISEYRNFQNYCKLDFVWRILPSDEKDEDHPSHIRQFFYTY
jgi:hypothetical protein